MLKAYIFERIKMNHLEQVKQKATKVTVVINALTIISMIVTFCFEPSRVLNRTTAMLASFASLLNIFLLVVYDNLDFEDGRFSLKGTLYNMKSAARDKISETADLAAIRSAVNEAAPLEEETENAPAEEQKQEETEEAFDTGLSQLFDSILICDVNTGSYRVFDPSESSAESAYSGDDFYTDIKNALDEKVPDAYREKVDALFEKEFLKGLSGVHTENFMMEDERGEVPSRISLRRDGESVVMGIVSISRN